MKNAGRISSLHDPRYRNLISNLVKVRKQINVTQVELAETLGLAQPDISKVERYERRLDILEFLGWLKCFSEKDKNIPTKFWLEVYEDYRRS